MAANRGWKSVNQSWQWLMGHLRPVSSSTRVTIVILAGLIGVLAGFGAIIFSQLIHVVNQCSVEPVMGLISESHLWRLLLCVIPAIGLLLVAWFTRRFAPEAQGHGVPEVITAIARHDGIIRPRVALVKIMASGFCIGTGGSIGREGPIVQIGSALGSTSEFCRNGGFARWCWDVWSA